jgi:FMN phosphatase YigB (HAD superfamily)
VKELCGRDFDDDELQLLWAKTYIINASMVSMLQYLRDRKRILVGLALNEDRGRWQYIVDTYQPETFSAVNVLSYEFGALKPERPFYEKMLEMCGRTNRPNRVLYVDDRQTHVDAAIAAGLQGYIFANEGEFSKAVADFLNLVPFEP